MEEGIDFLWLTAPVEIVGNAAGWSPACAARRWNWASRMLPAGARRFRWPVGIPARCGHVIYALGTSANPIIAQTSPGSRSTSGDTFRWTSAPR